MRNRFGLKEAPPVGLEKLPLPPTDNDIKRGQFLIHPDPSFAFLYDQVLTPGETDPNVSKYEKKTRPLLARLDVVHADTNRAEVPIVLTCNSQLEH